MQDFEGLGVFYLGKNYDLEARSARDAPLVYDARDLTTHAVCVGMTGSGKTGLGVALLEEAALDGIPSLVIDPKGDLSNLLLAFPELKPADFRPWIDPADAERRGISADELADQTSRTWREGLAAWGQDGQRIARFRDAVDAAIYTPGSNAGLPLAVLQSFAAPGAAILADEEALRDRLGGVVSGLLALLKIDADPLHGREHILLSTLIERAWREGRPLDVAALIQQVQSPPIEKIGVMDLESIFPAKDRFALAMKLNNLLASPGFGAWMQGAPLDIGRLLYTESGRPRLSIVSIAHLSDAERMFLVTLVLNEMVSWMRSQQGTSSLRAILYMDEVFGYFPPSANPPAKVPMLTLLKQARAFGLGIVLATQNPVDLDYKGLSNAGTWFIGRLQTERDKARVLDGLEGASAAAGAAFDRQKLASVISGLGNRVFLMNNVHEDQPVAFQTRWALSYLRGPLSREQIQVLTARRKEGAKPQAAEATPVAPVAKESAPNAVAPASGEAARGTTAAAASRPVLPPEIPEVFLPLPAAAATGEVVRYSAAVLGTARVHFVQSKASVDDWKTFVLLAGLRSAPPAQLWDDARILDQEPALEKAPAAESAFQSVPGEILRPKKFASLAGALKDAVYRTATLALWKSPGLKDVSRPGESEQQFRLRISQAVREQRDQKVEKLRSRYAPKLAVLQERIRRAQQKVEKEQSQSSQQTMQAVLSTGSSILGALFGRKIASTANVNRAATAMRAAGRASREKQDVALASENLKQLQEQHEALEAEFKAEAKTLDDAVSPDRLPLEQFTIKPKKADISVVQVSLAWVPTGAGGTSGFA